MHQIKWSVIFVTPEIAKRLLLFNFKNRELKNHKVALWKAALIAGKVGLTHQGIALKGTIENPERLLDGQHRLTAIVETGIGMWVGVAENVPEDAYKNIDCGYARTLAVRSELLVPEVQICSAVYYYAKKGASRSPSVDLIKGINELLSPFASHVSNRKNKAFSRVPLRVAFLLQQKVFGYNFSAEFQTGNFEVLPESLRALYRKQATNPLGSGGGIDQMIAFCAAWKAIKNPDFTKIYPPKHPRNESAEIISECLPEVVSLIARH